MSLVGWLLHLHSTLVKIATGAHVLLLAPQAALGVSRCGGELTLLRLIPPWLEADGWGRDKCAVITVLYHPDWCCGIMPSKAGLHLD
jgi:hypothetical protein